MPTSERASVTRPIYAKRIRRVQALHSALGGIHSVAHSENEAGEARQSKKDGADETEEIGRRKRVKTPDTRAEKTD